MECIICKRNEEKFQIECSQEAENIKTVLPILEKRIQQITQYKENPEKRSIECFNKVDIHCLNCVDLFWNDKKHCLCKRYDKTFKFSIKKLKRELKNEIY